MSNSKNTDTPDPKRVASLIKAFEAKHKRAPDWGEQWVISGNRRQGAYYKSQMKKSGLPVFLDAWTDIEWDRMSPTERSKSKDAKRSYERRLKKSKERSAEEARKAKAAISGIPGKTKITKKDELMPRVLHLLQLNYTRENIAAEVGVTIQTLSKWLNSVGIRKGKANVKSGDGANNITDMGPDYQEVLDIALDTGDIPPEEQHKLDRQDLDKKTPSHRKEVERQDKVNALPKMFQPGNPNDPESSSPAALYSGFMIAALTNKMHEAMRNIPAPQNIKEVKVLDDMISKHLGIDGRSGNASDNTLNIDISILNAKGRPKGKVVAAEIVKDNEERISDMVDIAHELEAKEVQDKTPADDFD